MIRFSGSSLLMIEPLRQDQAYHEFADERVLFGIQNAADTLSSLVLAVAGIVGLLFLRNRRRNTGCFETSAEAHAYWVLFGAVAATGLGSAWYHQAPDDARLVWDRLPMAIAFTSLLAAVISERVNRTAGLWLLPLLILLGAGSVVYWAVRGDLWPYAFVQFGSFAILVVLSMLFPSRYTRGGMLFAVLGAYAMAKIFEHHDRQIHEFGHWISGHTLKHLAGALAVWLIIQSLANRSVRERGGD